MTVWMKTRIYQAPMLRLVFGGFALWGGVVLAGGVHALVQ
jgi:hypothetical protein